MNYYLFNIGKPYNDEWWARHISMEMVTTGFDNAVGDRGERILRSLDDGDWVIAYANRHGAVGAGIVGGDESYRLVSKAKLPRGFESHHRHFRTVQWVYYVELLTDAVPFADLRLPTMRTHTKTKLTTPVAKRIIKLLAAKAIHDEVILADEQADWTGPKYVPKDGDRRKIVDRQIRERRGQTEFRDALRKRYKNRCAVTGCKVLAVLEAAHIKPYRGDDDHHPQNGLLLRSDIHTLFDLDLLGIEPTSLRVKLHPKLRKHEEYGNLNGTLLACPPGKSPSKEALKIRYKLFQSRSRKTI